MVNVVIDYKRVKKQQKEEEEDLQSSVNLLHCIKFWFIYGGPQILWLQRVFFVSLSLDNSFILYSWFYKIRKVTSACCK